MGLQWKKLSLILKIVFLTFVFSSCVHIVAVASASDAGRHCQTSHLATPMLVKPFAEHSRHTEEAGGGACDIVRVSHKGWSVVGGHWSMIWTWVIVGSFSPLSSEFAFLIPRNCPKDRLEIAMWCWDYLESVWMNPVKASVWTFKIWQVGTEIHSAFHFPR